MWILGNRYLDYLLILFPGVIGLAITPMMIGNTVGPINDLPFVFAVAAFVDSGHVYTTLWRTLFSADERASHKTYWLTPLIIFMVLFIWTWFKVPYLGTLLFYAIIWHNIRQYFGIQKWYQRLNGRYTKYSDYFVYALGFFPVIIAHMIPGQTKSTYINNNLLKLYVGIYAIIIALWVAYEVAIWLKGYREYNRILAIAIPCFLYAIMFLTSKVSPYPLLMAHGIPYMAIMVISMKRTKPKKYNSFLKPVIYVVVIAVIFGALHEKWELVMQDFISFFYAVFFGDSPDIKTEPQPFLKTFLLRLFYIPLFCHYVWDAHIWRAKHRESKLIYTREASVV